MIAYIPLFSALLSRLTALACDSTRVTSFYLARFFLISTEVVYLQRWHGWCHMKLQPSRRKFCVHHTTMLHLTSCKATYVRYLLRATAVSRGWNGYRNYFVSLVSCGRTFAHLYYVFEPQICITCSNHTFVSPWLTGRKTSIYLHTSALRASIAHSYYIL